jgi:predicted metal-dependent hydrolase
MCLILAEEPTVQFEEVAQLFIASFSRPSFAETRGEGVDRTPQVARPESRPESRLESPLAAKVLLILRNNEQGKVGMASALGHKTVSGELHKQIKRLQGLDWIEMTLPDKPNSRLQKYRLTPTGQDLIAKLAKEADKGKEEALREWYIGRAKENIIPRVKAHARRLGVDATRVKIADGHYRWGSCTTRNNVGFNWRLIKAPMFVIDYVIVHELAHLIETNHTPRFWNIVRTQAPMMEKAKAWLKENGGLLEEAI